MPPYTHPSPTAQDPLQSSFSHGNTPPRRLGGQRNCEKDANERATGTGQREEGGSHRKPQQDSLVGRAGLQTRAPPHDYGRVALPTGGPLYKGGRRSGWEGSVE